MVDRHELGVGGDAIDDELLLSEGLPERGIDPDYAPRADSELMDLRNVEAVLVEGNRVDAAERGDRRVVRDAGDRVAALFVRPDDLFVGLAAVGDAAPRNAVRVKVRFLPGAGE